MDLFDYTDSDNFNAREIAEEREHLSHVLNQIREQIELLKNDGFSYRTVDIYDEMDIEEYRTDKFRHDARLRDIRILEGALGTPYFARMKLKGTGVKTFIDTPSMTRARSVFDVDDTLGDEPDIYVGANVIFYKDKIIIYSHNSPLGNKVYDRFDGGRIEYGGYEYEVIFRRKFDIRDGVLKAVFQDYSKDTGGVVYDKFLAHMLKVKRGDKRLTDIIPTIQANQNAIITRPADENCVVRGCAGCGKTMILLQRLEYLGFNKKLELDSAVIVSPSAKYIEHIQPVVDDLMIGAARRTTMPELYRELILSLRGLRASDRKAISDCVPIGDELLSDEDVAVCYSDATKKKLITALAAVRKSYNERLKSYREELERYERQAVWATDAVKPRPPVVSVSLSRFPFIPPLGTGEKYTKAKLYLLLTAYCYVLGKPQFDAALFIDEGQDYFLNEYRLIKEITRTTVNVYGDENQQLVAGRGIGDFNKLSALWGDMQYYSLNENYRNAREITAFVNDLLGMSVTSLGLDGGSVKELGMDELQAELKKVNSDDRIAVIYSATDGETERKLRAFVPSDMLYTVAQAKGMEYERVYACGSLTAAEKYVTYTRALASLFIVS